MNGNCCKTEEKEKKVIKQTPILSQQDGSKHLCISEATGRFAIQFFLHVEKETVLEP